METSTDVRALFEKNALRARLEKIRDAGEKRLTHEFERWRAAQESGPIMEVDGTPRQPPELSDIESIGGACLLLGEPAGEED